MLAVGMIVIPKPVMFFAFGQISGILEGSIDDLVITYGQPSQFRADLHSVERRGVDQ